MNSGKNKCAYLKEIRKRIATENGIPLEQRECTFKGECSGTCPFCEAEMRYLEKELHKRRTLGKAVTVAGIALSSVMLFPACGPKNALQGEPELPSEPDTTLTVTDTVPADTVAEIPPPPSWDPEKPPVVGMIDEELYAPLEHDHAGTATAYSSLGSGKVITNM
ncbi:MAG: membrane receptor RagA [Bacteroidales bacterium]|nr:membrane receptor RagA [Bacteroidales bacterium]